MPRVCFILVAGLDHSLLARAAGAGGFKALGAFAKTTALQPVWPAVTSTMQATLTTGTPPAKHGIIANGLFTHNQPGLLGKLDLSSAADFRRNVSFWEQSNELLDAPRFWKDSGKKVAMLFWQNSMKGAADIVVTPKPEHTADGKTLTACFSSPPELYAEQVAKFGPFPLQHYWGPLAGLPSSQWIIHSAIDVWERHAPDLELVYVPHLDYCLQKFGPAHAGTLQELQAIDAEISRLVDAVRAAGGVPIICGDYAMSDAHSGVCPNVTLRQANLLAPKLEGNGKVLIDYAKSAAFAMVDHQVAHVYVRQGRVDEVLGLYNVPSVERIVSDPADIAALGLNHPRSGNILLIARKDAWFAHDWWLSEGEKPNWQFGVDIHRKPGYDPRELFFDPAKKIIAQSTSLVKGTHGAVSADPKEWPVLLCDANLAPPGGRIESTAVAAWLRKIMGF